MPGYARTLRTLALKLGENEGLLELHANEELTELEGLIDEFEEELDQAISVAKVTAEEAGDDEDEEAKPEEDEDE